MKVTGFRREGLPVAHLFAADDGIIGTHLMLLGKDGKAAKKNTQLAFAAEEIERLAK
ncbi:MAG: hypothetical protein KF873_20925 [Gemmataceae bacterium]|nr:hypothetical protein [Gemmataceae bacterium]